MEWSVGSSVTVALGLIALAWMSGASSRRSLARLHFATRSAVSLSAPRNSRDGRPRPLAIPVAALAARLPSGPPPTPRSPAVLWRRDPLAKHRARTGVEAQVRWWERVRSFVGLVIMVGFLGLLLAAILGLLVVGLRVGIEVVVG